jgi:hypothetical protein
MKIKQLKTIEIAYVDLDSLNLELELNALTSLRDHITGKAFSPIDLIYLEKSKLVVKDHHRTLYRYLMFNRNNFKNGKLRLQKNNTVTSWSTIRNIDIVKDFYDVHDKNLVVELVAKNVSKDDILLDVAATHEYLLMVQKQVLTKIAKHGKGFDEDGTKDYVIDDLKYELNKCITDLNKFKYEKEVVLHGSGINKLSNVNIYRISDRKVKRFDDLEIVKNFTVTY